MSGSHVSAQVDAARDGDRRALARLLTLVERGGDHARSVALAAQGHSSAAAGQSSQGYTVGLTGAPGSGKSTLTSALIHVMRRDGCRVAVLAIDPSSPFSGGALLGDRIRMGDHDLDPGVFIRSMATRGHLGGLALAVPEAVRLLTATGFDWVLLETVGVGQVEVEVAGTADTTVVVLNPGWGDRVQANKAGLMEIADVFVVNKADREGAKQTQRDLAGLLKLRDDTDGWRPPVLATVGTTGEGVDDLCAALGEHRSFLEASGQLAARRQRRGRDELRAVLVERLRSRAESVLGADGVVAVEAALDAGEIDPYTAADRLLGG